MNEDLLKGNWNQLKGKIKAKWGKLTDDDLQQIEGNHDRLIGKIQEKYGKDKEKAKKEFNDWIDSV
ncbi:MAG: CsbD family protein [Halanaerobium sp.]